MQLHRNSPKRYYDENEVYFVVVKTHNNFKYFKEPLLCDLLIEEIKICKEMKEFKLYGFSMIYDHLNLLLQPGEEYNISEVMKSLKENSSRDINYVIFNQHYVGDTSTCRLQIRELITIYKRQFIKKYGIKQNIIPKFKWQKSFYDHIIEDEKDFENQYIYTVYNFQKHNLPNDWQYTSLNYEDMVDDIQI